MSLAHIEAPTFETYLADCKSYWIWEPHYDAFARHAYDESINKGLYPFYHKFNVKPYLYSPDLRAFIYDCKLVVEEKKLPWITRVEEEAVCIYNRAKLFDRVPNPNDLVKPKMLRFLRPYIDYHNSEVNNTF